MSVTIMKENLPIQTRAEQKLKWERLIKSWKDSGLSKADFCKSIGLNKRTFDYQVQKAGDKTLMTSDAPLSRPSPSFMKLEIPNRTSVDSLEVQLSCGMQLIFKGLSNTGVILDVIRGLKS